MAIDARVPFLLALIGGLIALGTGLMFCVVMAVILSQAMPDAGAFPYLFIIMFGWIGLGGLVGGIIMLVSAAGLRKPSPPASARTAAIVGGAITILAANVLAGGLGIAAGVLASPPAR